MSRAAVYGTGSSFDGDFRVDCETDVPGSDHASSPSQQAQYDNLPTGQIIHVRETGNVYRKSDTLLYARGGRVELFMATGKAHVALLERVAKLESDDGAIAMLRLADSIAAMVVHSSRVDSEREPTRRGKCITRRYKR